MSLPKINTPEYRLVVPSTDEEIRYRPFLVKEEKLLLIAQETGTDKATYEAIRNIIIVRILCLYQKLTYQSILWSYPQLMRK